MPKQDRPRLSPRLVVDLVEVTDGRYVTARGVKSESTGVSAACSCRPRSASSALDALRLRPVRVLAQSTRLLCDDNGDRHAAAPRTYVVRLPSLGGNALSSAAC